MEVKLGKNNKRWKRTIMPKDWTNM